MDSFFAALLMIVGLIMGIYSVYYFRTLSERRKHKEKLRRKLLLYEEECRAEEAKQNARMAGETVRKRISDMVRRK